MEIVSFGLSFWSLHRKFFSCFDDLCMTVILFYCCSTRKVATYTYFMSRHGKVLFQDGEMEGYVKLNLNAQNRLEQRDGQHTPLFKFTTGSGLR